MRRLLIVILICLMLPISVLAVTYGKTGATTDFDGDINVPSGSGYYINGTQITSDALSDVASIAMLDEGEVITGCWDFTETILIFKEADNTAPYMDILRKRDGDPTSNVSENDIFGSIYFSGYHGGGVYGAQIRGAVDETPGAVDMPGRLEFLTTPDGEFTPVLRMAIDNAGNVKIGDGIWTDYVNITDSAEVTFVGAASITITDLLAELDAGAHTIGFTLGTATGDGTTEIDWKLGNKFQFTHGAMNETFTFDSPTNPCDVRIEIIQDGVGSRDCTWPPVVKWLGTEPTWTDGGANKTIIVSMWYNAAEYWAQGTPWEE